MKSTFVANSKKHMEVGAFVGTIGNVVLYLFHYLRDKMKKPNQKFNWCEFLTTILLGCALGTFTGIAADKFEPATHPNYRGFFHSYLFWILIGWSLLQILVGKQDRIWKHFAVIGFAGYSSHLLIDSQTLKSLPILGI